MADFDFSTLITDRGQSDLATLRSVLSTPMEEWTAEQLAAFNLAASRGAYNYTDLNRVTACMDHLNERLTALGYQTGYSPVVVHQPQPPGPVNPLPEGYTQLEYIQSSGAQYVDTGTYPNQDTRVLIDVRIDSQPTTIVGLFGVRDTSAATSPNKFIFWSMGTGSNIRSDYFGAYENVSRAERIVGERVVIDKNKNVCTVSNVVLTNTPATGQCAETLYLFCTNNAGDARYFANATLYSCQIYSGEGIIRDYIPCLDPTRSAGLYDVVDHQFVGNAGTGEFVAGPEVPVPEPEPEPLDPYTWYEEDVPTEYTMSRYLANVSALREVLTLPVNTAEVPADMAGLTLAEANAIEEILLVIEDYLTALASVFRRCGAAICGGPGFYFKN